MSVIRIHKTSDYTVMSNNHFREKKMSLKAKGLLSLMLSLPKDWDYSIAGLVTLSSDGETSVKNALKELEEFGYLERKRVYENGKIVDWEYNIYETPKRENLLVENQQVEKQDVENHAQSNTKQSNTNKKQLVNIDKEKYIKKVYEMYRQHCKNLPSVRVLSDGRKKSITKLLKHYTLSDIENCFIKAGNSDYLQGRVNGWKADFDWLLKEDKFVRVLEGRYDNYSSKSNKPWEKGVTSDKYTEEELQEEEKWRSEMRKKGVRVDY